MTALDPVTHPALSALPGIRHAFFTSEGGVSRGLYTSLNAGLGSNDDRAAVLENRARMAAHLAVEPADLRSPFQIHSAVAVHADAIGDERPKADAVVSDRPGVAAAIVTADCGPILFADPDAKIVAAAHAGWKGALTGILEATVDAMVERGATRERIVAVLGPTIGPDAYEVGPDFPQPFIDADPTAKRFFVPSIKAGHHMFDLPAFIAARLTAAGVQTHGVDRCTYHGPFFSYRRTTHREEPDYGRQLSAIVAE
ncbi:peptidoglycan editing factor PgeF [Rhizobiaceae bacterium]|nr:peptidoglycan editing factor PgeF [Rhizobiaceae bacterium]